MEQWAFPPLGAPEQPAWKPSVLLSRLLVWGGGEENMSPSLFVFWEPGSQVH